jgi:hypothetical protein
LLKGLIFGPGGVAMTPTHTRKRGRLYRYYVATTVLRSGVLDNCPIRRIPAVDIEAAVVEQIKSLVGSVEITAATWRAAKGQIQGPTERQVREHLRNFCEVWSELFPAEQARIVQLLVERVDVSAGGADITLRTEGLTALVTDLRPAVEHRGQAA